MTGDPIGARAVRPDEARQRRADPRPGVRDRLQLRPRQPRRASSTSRTCWSSASEMHGDEVVELLDEVGLVEPEIDLTRGAVVADDLTPARAGRGRRSPSSTPEVRRPGGGRTAVEAEPPDRADRRRDAGRAGAVPGEAVDGLRRRPAPVLGRLRRRGRDLRHRRARRRDGRSPAFRRGAPAEVVAVQAERRTARKAQAIADYVAPGYKLDDGKQMVVVSARDAGVGSQQIQFVAVPGQEQYDIINGAQHRRLRDVRARRALLDQRPASRRRPRPAAAPRGAGDRALHVQVRRRDRRRGRCSCRRRSAATTSWALLFKKRGLRRASSGIRSPRPWRTRRRRPRRSRPTRERDHRRAADRQRALLVQGAGRERRAGARARARGRLTRAR